MVAKIVEQTPVFAEASFQPRSVFGAEFLNSLLRRPARDHGPHRTAAFALALVRTPSNHEVSEQEHDRQHTRGNHRVKPKRGGRVQNQALDSYDASERGSRPRQQRPSGREAGS